MEAKHNYAGGLVAGMEVGTSAEFQDIYLENLIVKEATDSIAASQMVGGVIGRVQGNVTIRRTVAINLSVIGKKNVGGLIGKSDEIGAVVIMHNVYVNGSIAFSAEEITHANITVGNIQDHTPSIFNVWASGFATVGTNGLGVVEGQLIDPSLAQVESWWTTNISAIASSDLWVFAGGRYLLESLNKELLPTYAVHIVYDVAEVTDTVYITEGYPFVFTPRALPGFEFLGWYLDSGFTTPLPEGYVVTAEVNMYAKHGEVPASTVSFDTGDAGVTVADQLVNYGNLATLPTVPNTMIGGILKKVTGWTLDGVPYDFATPVTGNLHLDSVWETCTFLVTFTWPDATTTTQTVAYGELATEPETDPVHPMFASIVFEAWKLTGLTYDFATPVTGALTLTVGWTAPSVIEVTTLDQFHYLATVESTYSYKLMNDLDFTGYSWTTTGASFKGTFDGQGYTISNLTFTTTTGYGGIFARANGATISDLVLDNISVTSAERAGVLIGRMENGGSTISGIIVKNSDVTGANSNGVGGLAALVSVSSTISNIAVLNTTVTASGMKNVGGVIGRVDGGTLTASDIYVSGVIVESTLTSGEDIGAGGFVGYVRDSAASIVIADRIVIVNTEIKAMVGGAVIGYLRSPGTATVTNSYFKVIFTGCATSGLVGRINYTSVEPIIGPIASTSLFGSFTGEVSGTKTQTLSTTPVIPADAAWWTTNLSTIASSSLWTVNPDGTAVLNIAS